MFNWKHYFDISEEIQKSIINSHKYEQAYYRTIVSRCYYAIYNIALEFIKNKGLTPDNSSEGSHKKNWELFRSSPVIGKLGRAIFSKANDLRKRRIDADYNKNIEYNSKDIEDIIKNTKLVLRWIQKLENFNRLEI